MIIFDGEFEQTLDPKNRLRIPSKLKEMAKGEQLFMYRSELPCIQILPASAREKVLEKIEPFRISESAVSMPLRQWVSSCREVEEDNQGRFIVPKSLRERAGITKSVVFIGFGGRIEMWAKEVWEQQNAEIAWDKLKEAGI